MRVSQECSENLFLTRRIETRKIYNDERDVQEGKGTRYPIQIRASNFALTETERDDIPTPIPLKILPMKNMIGWLAAMISAQPVAKKNVVDNIVVLRPSLSRETLPTRLPMIAPIDTRACWKRKWRKFMTLIVRCYKKKLKSF